MLEGGYEIISVLTQPDRPAGRGRHLRASPVKQLAQENGVEVLQPESLADPNWQETLSGLKPDLLVVVAYGLMIPAWLLALPVLGCWNIHASLLPRWRGAAPIQRAIEAGDSKTGVCIMQMETSLDTGPVYHCLSTDIEASDNAAILHDRLAEMGATALIHCLDLVQADKLPAPRTQDHTQTVYASKLNKADAELDWNLPAEVLQRQVRAFNPWPVSWCELGGERVRIWQADVIESVPDLRPGQIYTDGQASLVIGTADKALKIIEIQRPGGKRISAASFLSTQKIPII